MKIDRNLIPIRRTKLRLRDFALAYASNSSNRANARALLAYVKRNPVSLVDAQHYDIAALSLASELIGG